MREFLCGAWGRGWRAPPFSLACFSLSLSSLSLQLPLCLNINNYNNESILPKLAPSSKNQVYRILCFDDDAILINTFVQKLNLLLVKNRPNLKFEFDVCYNFEMFYEKFSNNLNNKKHYHFFVLDQNISIYLKGVEIAEMIDRTYNACFGDRYDNLFINFLFVTEQAL